MWARSRSALLGALCAGVLVACNAAPARTRPVDVVATILPLADWARQVGGDRVHVQLVVPPGEDPRTYVPSEEQERAIHAADVVLLNGLGLEPWMDDILDAQRGGHTIVLEVSQFTGPTVQLTPPPGALEDGKSQLEPGIKATPTADPGPIIRSPYLWLDPRSAILQVDLIARTLARVDPAGVMVYRQNAASYSGELENLDSRIQRQVNAWKWKAALSNNLFLYPFARHYNVVLLPPDARTAGQRIAPRQPLVIDALARDAQPVPGGGLGRPVAILNPLAGKNYMDLMQTNVYTMTMSMEGP